MELRAFAEQILFGTTLEEKLHGAESIIDTRPGAALETPAVPGRPPELRFKPLGTGKMDFPSVQSLTRERERGRLLHYFANHELLAVELMALVLLRFPEAPAAFRRGVLQTLRDEQAHTRLYLERMRACGIEFGELPVSGFFWRAVSAMQNPLDYVAGLSLTFEQANLDFCRHFAREFKVLGDEATAGLLERIYHDEIGHVAYGLKWFRRWKDPKINDWEAFCGQLRFPLSPSRAKGVGWNVEGRRAAGLDASFIAQLHVHSQSKGRTPCVFVFNPFVERRIACGPSFTPIQEQAWLGRDLENLPQFLARQDDIVLVTKRPSIEFLSGLKSAGFPLPEFVELKNGRLDPENDLLGRQIGGLRPWAWGPDSVEMLGPLFPYVTGENSAVARRFNDGVAELYSKAWSARLLRRVLKRERERRRDVTWLCGEDEVGVSVNTFEHALDVIRTIRERGHVRIVVKEALGLAGQNMIRLWEPELLEKQRRWITHALEQGRELVIEPWLEREADFSVQFEMQTSGLKLCGYTGLQNDPRGQFQANWAEPNYRQRPPRIVVSNFPQPGRVQSAIHELYRNVAELLAEELCARGFLGPLGLDAFVYRAGDGSWRLKPIVEINPRYTMGRVTLELMRYVCPGSYGRFRLMTRERARAGEDGGSGGDLAGYAQALARTQPLCCSGEPVPKIRQGAVCLNDPASVQRYLAVFEVQAAALGLEE